MFAHERYKELKSISPTFNKQFLTNFLAPKNGKEKQKSVWKHFCTRKLLVKYWWNWHPGVHFINILRANFLYESALGNDSLVTFWLCVFFGAKILAQKVRVKCWYSWDLPWREEPSWREQLLRLSVCWKTVRKIDYENSIHDYICVVYVHLK